MVVKRKIEWDIKKNLGSELILILMGARQTGKSTLLRAIRDMLEGEGAVSYLFSLEDPLLLADLNRHPENIYSYIPRSTKKTFLLLDEIQYLDDPSNFLKYHYDSAAGKIKLIVTGSSAFYIDQKFKDSLAGRKRIFHILPFCFSEFLLMRGEDELADLFSIRSGVSFTEKLNLLIPQERSVGPLLSEYLVFGGYPTVVREENREEKKTVLKDLHQSFLRKDVLESRIRSEESLFRCLKLLASQTGQLVNVNELSNTLGVSRDAVNNYLYLLQKSFIIQLLRPFENNMRKELTKMPKIFFFDNGYRNSILNRFEGPDDLLGDGSLLENSVFTELKKRAEEDLRFWRTQDGHEVDFIVNETIALEVKKNLKKFNPGKYRRFIDSYPSIPLHPVSFRDDEKSDLRDFLV